MVPGPGHAAGGGSGPAVNPYTPDTASARAPTHRLQRLEDPVGDFPFYNGAPVALSMAQWLLVMAGVVAGFAALVWPVDWPGGLLAPMIPAVLFVAIPLAVLARVAPGHCACSSAGWAGASCA